MGTSNSVESCPLSKINITEDCSIKQSLVSLSEHYTQTEYKIPCLPFKKITNTYKELPNIIIIFSQNGYMSNISCYDLKDKQILSSHQFTNKTIQCCVVNDGFIIISFDGQVIEFIQVYPNYKLIYKQNIVYKSLVSYFFNNNVSDLMTNVYNYNTYIIFEYSYMKSTNKHHNIVIIDKKNNDVHHIFTDYVIKCLCRNNIMIIYNVTNNKYAYYNMDIKKCAYTGKEFIDNVGELIIEYNKQTKKIVISSTKTLVFDDCFENEYIIID